MLQDSLVQLERIVNTPLPHAVRECYAGGRRLIVSVCVAAQLGRSDTRADILHLRLVAYTFLLLCPFQLVSLSTSRREEAV